ncbi:MAG: hypothetical protein KIT44_06385 [Opitutaceae bacterium]|nr:hypothetical protein [Opitutaceae bacterium]
MDGSLLLRALLVWVLLALAEILQGILRVRLLNRRVGDHRARQIGVGTGSLMILLIAWFTVPWLAPASTAECLQIGGLWVVAMLGLEMYFGRFVFRLPWARIAADFDLRRGRLLGLGMLVLFFAPLIASLLRGL